jgi:hypothetical protein
MNYRTLVSLFLTILVVFAATAALAQEPTAEQEERVAEIEENLKYEDYTVKAYRLSFYGGHFSGATYLESPERGERTVLTPGAADVLGYDGEVLLESRAEYETGPMAGKLKYDAPHKTIEPGTAYGGRVGIYISKDFHLDLLGTYATGKAVTTMIGPANVDDDYNPANITRRTIDTDDGFKMVKGGLALMYDARPATFFGIMPRLGFGLGGIINRYSYLPDKTGLYLEGNLGLSYDVTHNLSLTGQVDLTTFAFEVDELGYSNMVNYKTFTIGLSWFIDVVPADVRAAHQAALEASEY